ncbi:hypothetical protein C7974DRAFT_321466 [Boeremia exigua]|uniref:uncharacterized protein n=1 Tax=Boeremia exigua TaxID=749465 RepID=UPI001E8D18AF|nr:uncharacterized protein C7974DRAFT_321466 [Boeremia exigua]KAH6613973.1 hypothetical protein C7974DRAFT_321466 [Boeremia exigua]
METYSGQGEIENDLRQDPPCHSRACAIQNCIQKNNFNEEKCRKEVDALYACCNAFYKEKGDDARCVTCPKPDLLRIKLKQRAVGT